MLAFSFDLSEKKMYKEWKKEYLCDRFLYARMHALKIMLILLGTVRLDFGRINLLSQRDRFISLRLSWAAFHEYKKMGNIKSPKS